MVRTILLEVICFASLLRQVVLNYAGQLNFSKAAYACACGHKVWQGIEEFISIGFWPATVTRVRIPVSPPVDLGSSLHTKM